ncbi:MAG: hypothetical protein ACRDOP_03760 [Gaiellaceae bacterium]
MASEPAVDPREYASEDAPLETGAPAPPLTIVTGDRPVSDHRRVAYGPFVVGAGLAVWTAAIYTFLRLVTDAFG